MFNIQRRTALHHFCLEKPLDARCMVPCDESMNVSDESLRLPNRTQSTGEELANGISHGIGLLGAIIGTPILLLAAAALVNRRRHRLHGRHFIFRERAAALCPFCLASVRARRN